MPEFLILGSGFTGSRVARILRAQGESVHEFHRTDIDFTQANAAEQLRARVTPGCRVLHSVPSLPNDADRTLVQALAPGAARVVYLSTTGVYGDAEGVDEHTPIAPRNEREAARARTEAAVLEGPWSALVLRPAAIYGPGRGVHVSMAQGKYALLGDGSNYISRIHVEDLARVAAKALLGSLEGAYPVADQYPCTSREMAEYCALKFGLPMPVSETEANVPATRRNNRRVDGRAIFRLLDCALLYPSYLEGLNAV